MDFKGINITLVLLSLTGGVARYAKEYLETGHFQIGKLVANIILCAFAGVMFGYFGQVLNVTPQVQWIMAGVGGFMGLETLNFIFATLTKKKGNI